MRSAHIYRRAVATPPVVRLMQLKPLSDLVYFVVAGCQSVVLDAAIPGMREAMIRYPGTAMIAAGLQKNECN